MLERDHTRSKTMGTSHQRYNRALRKEVKAWSLGRGRLSEKPKYYERFTQGMFERQQCIETRKSDHSRDNRYFYQLKMERVTHWKFQKICKRPSITTALLLKNHRIPEYMMESNSKTPITNDWPNEETTGEQSDTIKISIVNQRKLSYKQRRHLRIENIKRWVRTGSVGI